MQTDPENKYYFENRNNPWALDQPEKNFDLSSDSDQCCNIQNNNDHSVKFPPIQSMDLPTGADQCYKLEKENNPWENQGPPNTA